MRPASGKPPIPQPRDRSGRRRRRHPARRIGAVAACAAVAIGLLAPAAVAETRADRPSRPARVVTSGATAAAAPAADLGWAGLADRVDELTTVGSDDVAIVVTALDGSFTYEHNAATAMVAASTIKLLALAGVLELAQDEGRMLSARELALAEPMIAESDNDAATALMTYLASKGRPVAALGDAWGVEGAQHPSWGLSMVTAADMAGLVAQLFGGSRLGAAYGREASRILDLVPEDFDHGWRVAVGYGLPTGWQEMSKVGELTYGPYGLHLHGVGLIEQPNGTTYAVAVLARNWRGYADEARAIRELNAVGAEISCLLATGVLCR